ncbi:hypothetical protein [Amycolatopsis sp. lyj-23]|uniref:hypothetical protein n=1 Tax=Amycolatopsis sp. lyj-23 TaxID=2789283 RepID=UPI00397A12B8
MTDFERELAEALRGQAEEVTPDLDAAWAEQQRRQQRPPSRRRAAVWVAPLAAVLVVLTSVLLATQLHTAPPAQPGAPLVYSKFTPEPMPSLFGQYDSVRLTDFVGQTNTWTAYAFRTEGRGGLTELLCVASVPTGRPLAIGIPLYGDGPRCIPTEDLPPHGVRAAYIGDPLGPLPPDKAVFLTDPTLRTLRLFASNGDLTQARPVGRLSDFLVYVADVTPGSPPVRFQIS